VNILGNLGRLGLSAGQNTHQLSIRSTATKYLCASSQIVKFHTVPKSEKSFPFAYFLRKPTLNGSGEALPKQLFER
jgi:hypothetical protein